MLKSIIILLLFVLMVIFHGNAQLNLHQNPGPENEPASFTVPVGTPQVNPMKKVSSDNVSSNQFVRYYNNELTTRNFSKNTIICPALNNKKAIYVFTFLKRK